MTMPLYGVHIVKSVIKKMLAKPVKLYFYDLDKEFKNIFTLRWRNLSQPKIFLITQLLAMKMIISIKMITIKMNICIVFFQK